MLERRVLRIQAAAQVSLRDLVDAGHERSHAHGGALFCGEVQRPLKRRRHEVTQAVLNVSGLPEESLSVLHPFKIGDNDAPGVSKNVRNHENSLVLNDPVGFERGRAIGSFCEDTTIELGGVSLGDLFR